ncbi:MAG: aminotransferase class I/II-fold pyridoxal phosphate-dependent enzyme [Ruminococcaceae bacterium]|nr:aminotransferase class I/II-fold pyridoxal phosphate-dependent enzyme [Oscillospiraceae bacterium]
MDYQDILSKRAQSLKPSGIRRFFDMIQGAVDVVALTVGQPDFDTPWHIREAGIESLRQGKTYYTSNAGLPEMRRQIADYLSRRFDLSYDPQEEIIVTIGGSEAIDMAMRALIDPGDEVIVPQPSFVCYSPLVTMAGGVPIELVTTEKTGFKLTAQALASVLTERTKLLVLPYPNNPTGAIMTREDLEPIAELLAERNIMVLSDEIYAEMTYGRRHVSIASLPHMRERTIVVNGFSKAYAMTGWRMGYAAAPAPIAAQMLKLHQYGIMCAPTTSQYAAIEALENGDEDIAYMTAEYDRRRRFIVDGLRRIGIPCHEPEGAFYVFPQIGAFGMTSEEFCKRLLEEHRVAIVPGTAFGDCGEGFARISYAYSVEHIAQALTRIEAFVEKLKQE